MIKFASQISICDAFFVLQIFFSIIVTEENQLEFLGTQVILDPLGLVLIIF